MRELINLIPFLDLTIVALLVVFIYLGWTHGMPRLAMVVGAIYTGFLLASVYYHLFAVSLVRGLGLKNPFMADLVSFIVLCSLITAVMLALLFSLYGHIEIKGRIAVFDKIGGTLIGFFAGILAIGILVTLLRLPHEASKRSLNTAAEQPVVQVFNNGYEKSALAPVFVRAAPLLITSMKPMLPSSVQAKGAVPLLESLIAEQ